MVNPREIIICGQDEKYCNTCKQVKDKKDFNKNKSKNDGLNSICRECSNKSSKKYYFENVEYHKTIINKRKIRLTLENRKKVFSYLKENPCIDCGNDNPVVLDFDHRDGVIKVGNVCDLIGRVNSWSKIEAEIDKCDVRCSNCHRIRTAKQQGWYQNLIDDGYWNFD